MRFVVFTLLSSLTDLTEDLSLLSVTLQFQIDAREVIILCVPLSFQFSAQHTDSGCPGSEAVAEILCRQS